MLVKFSASDVLVPIKIVLSNKQDCQVDQETSKQIVQQMGWAENDCIWNVLSIDEMTVDEMFVDKMTVDEMSVAKLPLDNITAYVIIVGEMNVDACRRNDCRCL